MANRVVRAGIPPKELKVVPKDIEFMVPYRTRSDAMSCRVALSIAKKDGKKSIKLIVTRDALIEAGFKPGQKLIILQGKPPHARWIRVEAAKYGQKLGEKGAVSLSLKSIIRSDLAITSEVVTPLPGKNSVYFELPETWIHHSLR